MSEFKGKTILITGASAGVGAATARLFAARGANLVLAARTEGPLQALARELNADTLAVPMNVADPQACSRLISDAVERFGGIDVLVNNAGCNHRGAVADLEVKQLEEIIDVNLKAPVRLSRLALPHLRERRGAIVNIASLAGRVPLDHEATYSASKFGLRAFSFALGEELAETGVRVSVISPGPIETGFIRDDLDSVPDLVFSQPMSTAEQVAEAVLASVRDGRRERPMPVASGLLAHMAYLFPKLRQWLKPMLEAKGHKAKEAFRAKAGL